MQEDLLFPYDSFRNVQKEIIEDLYKAIEKKNHAIIHAPTGLGKTVSALTPALTIALKNKLKIFFLTSRHTQHKIVLETAQNIKKKHNVNFLVTSFVGKKHMCLQENVETMNSSTFNEYCKALREEKECTYYLNAKNKAKQKIVIEELKILPPLHSEELKSNCSIHKVCPYELASDLAEQSQIIIADYHYLFNPFIQKTFFNKIKADLEESIIIVDEAHNLPQRAREVLSSRLSVRLLKRAMSETNKFALESLNENLGEILRLITESVNSLRVEEERVIQKNYFLEKINEIKNIDVLIPELKVAADLILTKQKKSSLNVIAEFLELWPQGSKEFTRYVKNEKDNPQIVLSCLDPSLVTKNIIASSYATILMSGTLLPTIMYQDILGFPQGTFKKEYPSPFPEQNKLAITIPSTTTKYTQRTQEQYSNIALIISNITNNVKGNSIVFFPSYYLKDKVSELFIEKTDKTTLFEQPGMTKEQKKELLEKFTNYKETGAVLMSVASGSFGEGIDLPGVIKCVIVVGLPLEKPDIETNARIQYYDLLFGKGWDYAYTLPAITKTLQNAGRCIRSETDRGVLIFLDERYAWPKYKNCFPRDWNMKITENYLPLIKEFFK
ncbi:ATP-dependent DNA helicase [archaeon]|nr:ATP-dependent DNA helicase [archaeon]